MGFLAGKRALIVGIASHRSIAWGIAQAMHNQGAELAFTYQNERLRDRVEDAAKTFGSDIVLPCDVANDDEIANLFSTLGERWDGLDILVHSVGFAPREALQGEFLDGLTRENFGIAHDVSSYSLAALAKAQAERDVLTAHGILMDAFWTDVRPQLAQWRTERGLPEDLMAAL